MYFPSLAHTAIKLISKCRDELDIADGVGSNSNNDNEKLVS